MKTFLPTWQRVLEKLRTQLLFKTTRAKRTLLRSEAHEREVNEAERLDRLRNPRNYVGR
jgi:hypothetical protein